MTMKGEHKIIEAFELTSQKDDKDYDIFFLKRLTKGKEKDLGRSGVGKFYCSVWGLAETDERDPNNYISLFQRMRDEVKYFSLFMILDGRRYQLNIPHQTPTKIVFTELDEYVRDFRNKWERIKCNHA